MTKIALEFELDVKWHYFYVKEYFDNYNTYFLSFVDGVHFSIRYA